MANTWTQQAGNMTPVAAPNEYTSHSTKVLNTQSNSAYNGPTAQEIGTEVFKALIAASHQQESGEPLRIQVVMPNGTVLADVIADEMKRHSKLVQATRKVVG